IDDSMKQKLDAALDTVKEPESGLSVGEIGLVQKFRYVSSKKTLYVYRNPIAPSKGCCTIMSNMLLAATQKNFLDALKASFPELTIELVVPTFSEKK
ncbi:MAG: hypothetical protein KAR45_15950, partial [Desulfobacteraceae bacterium]|nr:hypothetical protein [Desulfobacteraceae bacterium]